MDCLETSHLINELKSDREIHVILMSHNSYWTELQKLESRYRNFHLEICGDGLVYLEKKRMEEIENSDLILFYSSNLFNEKYLEGIKEIAFRISRNKNKRVSIGYSYVIPKSERIDSSTSDKVKLISFKDDIEYGESTYGFPYFSALDLLEMTMVTHDELENQKIKFPNF